MTYEERMKLYDDFHDGVRMIMDKLEKIAKSRDSFSLSEIGYLSDIMKDLATTEKCIAKSHYLYSEKSDEKY